MPQSSQTPPNHAIKFSEQVLAFELSHTEFGSNLACVSLPNKIIIGIIRFPEESDEGEFFWQILREIHCDSSCSYSLCFSPETSLAKLPKVVTLCAAGGDFLLRIFRTDMQNTDRVQELKGHTSYVNDVAWDNCGEYIASVSDDQSCIVWHNEDNFESTTKFCLSSAGVAVKWHVDDAKLLIAEKKGIIKMYNVKTEQAIMSLESSNIPLMNADWSIHNRFIVAGIGSGNVIFWDLRRSSQPIDVKQIHEDCGKIVKISPLTESVTASIGCPEITLKVNTSKSHIPLVEFSLSLYGGLCWHSHLPYVAAANDRKLCFWKVQIK